MVGRTVGSSLEKSLLRRKQSKRWLGLQGTNYPGDLTTVQECNTDWGKCVKPRVWGSAAEQHREGRQFRAQSQSKMALLPCAAFLWYSDQ